MSFMGTGVATNLPSVAGGAYGSTSNLVPDAYKTLITVSSTDSSVDGISILAHTPPELNFQVQGGWSERGGTIGDWKSSNPNSGGIMAGVSQDQIKSLISTTTGLTAYNKFLTAPVWEGSSSLNLQFAFEFHAYADPLTEVWIPTYALAALASPYEYLEVAGLPTGMLHAPGPTILPSSLTEAAGGILSALQGDRINVYVGSMLMFHNVILKSVGCNILQRIWVGGQHLPIATKVDVEFQTYFVTTRQDLAKYFMLEGGLAGAAATGAIMQGASAAMEEALGGGEFWA